MNHFDLLAPDRASPVRSGVDYVGRENDDYGTPLYYAGRVRAALGGRIACDPASSGDNTVIRAETFHTYIDSGLNRNNLWLSPVYLNPPASARQRFLERAASEAEGGCEMVISLNVKHICNAYTMRSVIPHVSAFHIPEGRVAFTHGGAPRSESPTDGCVFLYIGPNPDIFALAFARDAGWTCLVRPMSVERKPGHARVVE